MDIWHLFDLINTTTNTLVGRFCYCSSSCQIDFQWVNLHVVFLLQVSLQGHFVFLSESTLLYISRKLAGNGGNKECESVLKVNILLSVIRAECDATAGVYSSRWSRSAPDSLLNWAGSEDEPIIQSQNLRNNLWAFRIRAESDATVSVYSSKQFSSASDSP